MVDARIAKLDDLGVPTGSERERILIIASIAESEVGSDKYYGRSQGSFSTVLTATWRSVWTRLSPTV